MPTNDGPASATAVDFVKLLLILPVALLLGCLAGYVTARIALWANPAAWDYYLPGYHSGLGFNITLPLAAMTFLVLHAARLIIGGRHFDRLGDNGGNKPEPLQLTILGVSAVGCLPAFVVSAMVIMQAHTHTPFGSTLLHQTTARAFAHPFDTTFNAILHLVWSAGGVTAGIVGFAMSFAYREGERSSS
jgi:hypothetical protein